MSGVYDPIPAETRRAIAGDGLLNARAVKHLLKMGRQWKPTVYGTHYDDHVRKRRLLYEKKTEAVLDDWLRKTYPHTHQRMTKLGVSTLRLSADLDATTYDRVSRRWIERSGKMLLSDAIVDEKGNVLEEANPAALQFDRMVRRAKMDSVMLEGERRVNVTHSQPLRIDVDHVNERLVLRPFWPCDVWIVPFAPWADSLDYALAVITRVSGGAGAVDTKESRRYLLEVRSIETAGGDVAFGNWRRMFFDEEGNVWAPPEGVEWDLPLPMTMWHLGIPDGPFIDMNRDDVRFELANAESWTNLFFILQMQAHDETWLETESTKKRSLVVGPGAFNQGRPGEKYSTITRNPKIREYLDVIDAFARVKAKAQRQSEDSLSKEPSAPMTGVSRLIKDRHAEKAARERELYAIQHEQEQLLERMARIHDRFFGTTIHNDANVYRMAPDAPPAYEDPTARDTRIDKAVANGEISRARGAVMKGLYPDESAAFAAGLSRALVKQAAASGGGDRDGEVGE